MRAPYEAFGETRDVEVRVYINGTLKSVGEWDETFWFERPEDWYALLTSSLKDKRVRVITPALWARARPKGVA